MRPRTITAIVAAGALWALLAVWVAWRPGRPLSDTSADASGAASARVTATEPVAFPSAVPRPAPWPAAASAPRAAASVVVPVASAVTELDEPKLMAELRPLVGKDPERALELARKGDARFPDGPDAAERSWIVVKSLTDVGRFAEARAEATRMVARFRGTSWEKDVFHHVLEQPAGPPPGAREENQ